ncbi:MAG: hypothetical protein AB1568_01200 [Thermodesulfobacteriota bacterium]
MRSVPVQGRRNRGTGEVIVLALTCLLALSLNGTRAFAGEGTESSLAVVEAPARPDHAKVAVAVSAGETAVYQTNGRILPQELRVTMDESVDIVSGEYQGWGYGHGRYSAGELRGDLYVVRHGGEERGMVTGDVRATMHASGDKGAAWFVDWLKARPEAGRRVALAPVARQAGETVRHEDVMLLIFRDMKLAAGSASPYEQTSTLLLLPSVDGRPHNMGRWKGAGLEFGTYREGAESGLVWFYLGNRPGIGISAGPERFGVRHGPHASPLPLQLSGPLRKGGAARMLVFP